MMPNYVRLLAARDLMTGGDSAGAIVFIRQIVKDAPGYSTARHPLGDLLMHQQQFSAAEREYAIVCKVQPENAEAQAGWANSLVAPWVA
jgi:Flp pilus assembly protein TadD